ncbi:M56 family metallopeptidase [Clostridium sp.]|uniref:M56 family metallopeptidase n=1 Tax=Clostridium sp. TaxID=1506 RepID=UPI002FCA8454
MSLLSEVLYDLSAYMVNSSFMATVLVLLILLIRIALKHRLGIKLQYALWFILILRLLLPMAPVSSLSIYNYVPDMEQYSKSYFSNIVPMNTPVNSGEHLNFEQFDFEGLNLMNYSASEAQPTNYIEKIFPKLWILGVIIYLTIILVSYLIFLSSLKNSSEIKEKNIIEIFNQCKKTIGISKRITLIETNTVKTPILLGFINPKILVPSNLLNSSNHVHLRYAFLHEISHIKRKDILVNYICSLLSILYWFNPMIWYGFHKMREDRELCCDTLALSCINDKEVYEYGFTIIKLAEFSSRAPWLPGMAGIINNKSKIKRRITMIKVFKKNSYKLSILAIVTLLFVSFISLTDAKAESSTNEISVVTEDNAKPKQIIFDKIDYPFVDDEQLIGKWTSVNFVFEMSDFDPSSKFWTNELYFKSMTILPNGKIDHPISTDIPNPPKGAVKWLTWTNGYIIHHGDTTASQYTIQEINGSQYMFMEWKSGDYTLRGQKPYYYVLKKVE